VDNPFQYTKPVSAAIDLIDREDEAAKLLTWAREQTNVRLVAPRRFGKTSLLKRVLADASELGGWVTVYVDFFGVLSVPDVAHRIETAYATHLTGSLGAWFQAVRRGLRPNIRLGTPLASIGTEFDLTNDDGLLERLDLPAKVAKRSGGRVLVVFDEFQEVLAAGSNIDAVIRSRIQHHSDVSYVFAGSQVGMLNELFTDPARAFYAQARPLEIGPLPFDEIATYVDGVFVATGKQIANAVGPLLDVAQGHPQRTMLLAHHLWEGTAAGGTADEVTFAEAYDRAMAEEEDAFRAAWEALSLNERRVATRIALGVETLYTRNPATPMPRSSVSTAVGSLRYAAMVADDRGTVTGLRLVDPLFSAWIRAGRST
jgi:uncharacterized protein